MRPRSLFATILALAVCALGGALVCGQAWAAPAKKPAEAAPANTSPSGRRITITCPDSAGVGEPFVLRVHADRPLEGAEAGFQGRYAPLDFRPSEKGGKGYEAVALLGADVISARPGPAEVRVRLGGKSRRPVTTRIVTARITLTAVDHPEESLTLPPDMVNPPASELPRIASERARSKAALAPATPRRLWSLPLLRPVPGEVSSIYGLKRVLNGQPKSPHRGLDLEAETGQEVRAAADGVVALTGGFYYAGNCVYLDHGQGLATMYFHLSKVLVEPGARVARGQVIGLAGDTGRSTRSHLHFGVSALGRLVDPEPLFLYDALP